MTSRVYVLGTRSKLTALLVAIVLIGVVGMLLAVGFTVLIALAVIGTLAGFMAIARRAVRARVDRALGRAPDRIVLDPAQQVFPATPAPRLEDRSGDPCGR